MHLVSLAVGYMKRKDRAPTRRGLLPCFAAISAILLATILVSPAQAGYAAIVIDADTGRVLHSRNADTPNFPASLTKMMTLFMTFEALDKGTLKLNQPLRVSKRAAGQPASKLGLKEGATIMVDDAIRALSVKSANDVATVLAEAIGRTEINFAQMMTKRARALGMTRTSFRNASGLPNRRQKSTARDMSVLAMALIDRFPKYYSYFSQPSFKYNGKRYSNHNTLLKNYAGTDGIKTGYIRASGFNLVASTERDGVRLIGVVFGGKTAKRRDRHMQSLLNRSWALARRNSTIAAIPVPKPEIPGEKEITTAFINKPVAPTLALAAPAAATPTAAPVAAARVAPQTLPGTIRRSTIEGQPLTTTVATGRIPGPVPPTVVRGTEANWGIQIGAFEEYTDAHSAVGNVVQRLIALPHTASLRILPVDETSDTLYRARLMGMDEVAARGSCQQLLGNGQVCVLVTPQGNELASLGEQ